MTDTPISHAFVLPDENFFVWLQALQPYLNTFPQVVVVRSPAGNDLNPFRNVSTVAAPRMWLDDNPFRHIRRIYPQVVRIDVVPGSTPAQMRQRLQTRIANTDRYGLQTNTPPHIYERFVVGWATTFRPLRIVRAFSDDYFGVDILTSAGAQVIAGAAGKVTRQWAGDDDAALRLGKYVQVTTRRGNKSYIITYAGLQRVAVPLHAQVLVGQTLGKAARDRLTLIMQQPGNGSDAYRLPDIIDPTRRIYVTNLRLRPTVSGLRVRTIPSRDGKIIGQVDPSDRLITKEIHGRALAKVGTDENADKWIKIDMPGRQDGYLAAWLTEALVKTRTRLGNINPVGVNLDAFHPLGTPDPSRLGGIGWVRLAYNVSRGTGSEDIAAAYNRYAPLAARYKAAGYNVIFVLTHQTYGEGKAEYWWSRMDDAAWRDYSDKFAAFVRRIVGQWASSDTVACWQIWNEQDALLGAEAAVPMTAANYAYLLEKTVPAIRAEDGEAFVITGGHTGGPVRGGDYARQVINALPAAALVDGIAVHPYGRGADPDSPYAPFGHIDETMNAYAPILKGKPLWFTEWGVLDRPNDSPAAIAEYALSFITYLKARYTTQIATLIWYAWAQGMHNGYGIVDSNGQARPPLTEQFLQA